MKWGHSKTRIIHYIIDFKCNEIAYAKEIGPTAKIDSYIQFIVLKKTLESISFSYRRDGEATFQENLEEVVVLVKDMSC